MVTNRHAVPSETTHSAPAGEAEAIAVAIGHDTNAEAQTGCTVVMFDRPALTVVDVRGGAPGTRETDLLAPGRLVRRADAILLTGGSAFGLAAADGVMRVLARRQRGHETRSGPIPIVPSAVIYDLGIGEPVAPDAASGERACAAARPVAAVARGRVGAGTGATTGKISRIDRPRRGGFGIGTWSWDAGTITALAVVNAFGVVEAAGDGEVPPPAVDPRHALFDDAAPDIRIGEATTLIVLLVDAPTDYSSLVLATIAAHDGLARRILPCHTVFDGDIVFAAALREREGLTPREALQIGIAAEIAVERAIVDAVTS